MAQTENWWDSDAPETPAAPAAKTDAGDWWKDDKPVAPGALRGAADTALAFGTGAVQGVKGVVDAFGAGSETSESLGRAAQKLQSMESPFRQAEKQRRAGIIDEAEKSGDTWDQVKAYAGSFAEAPIDTTVGALGSSLPTLALGLIPGAGQAALAARAAQVGMGAVQGAGIAKGSIYDAVKSEQIAAGMSEAEAEKRALEAQAYSGDNVGNIAGAAALGGVAGGTGAEAAVRRIAGDKIAREAVRGGVARGAAKGVLAEAPLEGLQGGQERYAANVALQREGFDVPTWRGVAGQAALEAMASAPIGGGFGAVEGMRARPKPPGVTDEEWQTILGAGDPDAIRPEVQPVEAPDLTTAPGAAEPRTGMDFTRDVDTSGLSLQDPAEIERARAQTIDFQRQDVTPEWGTSQGAGVPREGLTMPPRQIDSSGLSLTPSEAMGIDPSAGPLSRAAASAVDSGATQSMQQAAAPQLEMNERPDGTLMVAGDFNAIRAQLVESGIPAQSIIRNMRGATVGRTQAQAARQALSTQQEAANVSTPAPVQRTTDTGAGTGSAQPETGVPAGVGSSERGTGLAAPDAELATGGDGSGRPVAAAAVAPAAVGRDSEWMAFASDTNTLGIPRSEMPQIKAEHRGAMVNFLKGRGVTSDQSEVDPRTLKPTQAEFSIKKVEKATGFDGPDRSILVSSDNHVVDGHHQWLAKLATGQAVKVIRLNSPIAELLPLVREFPSSTIDQATDVQNQPQGASGTQAQAAPVEARAPESGNTPATASVPAAPGAGDVQADGVAGEVDSIADLPGVEPGDRLEMFGPRGLKGNSWVLREKATGRAIEETRNPAKVRKLNTGKYEAVPIGRHLADLNDPTTPAYAWMRGTLKTSAEPAQKTAKTEQVAKAPAEPVKPEPAPQQKAEKPQDAQFSVADAKRKKKGITAEQYEQNLSAWSNGGAKVLADKADDYAFKSGQAVLLEAFHGTGRGDRVGTKFLKKRATSGPMSFFTSSPELASGYATGKQDTSLYNEDNNYANWFRYQPKGQRSPVPLDRAWYSMDEATKQRIAERMSDIRTDDDGNVIYEAGGGDIGSYQWNLKQTQRGYDKRGNPLAAAIETWLMSGSMFGEEQDFMKVLKLAGVPVSDITYDNPSETFPFVYKTWVRMNSPLVTSDVPARVEQALKAAALKDRSRAQQGGADTWDKNTRTLRDWVKEYFEPSNGDNKFVWTSIPDKVTEVLRSEGYDGIIDWSGKAGGATHPVYIPFEQNQVKSAIGNNGKFDNSKDDILMSILGEDVQADATYPPASQAHQKAATAFAERLSKNRDSFVLMDAVKPTGARAKEAQSVADLAKTMFGREVVFVKFKGRPLFNGAVSTTDPGKVFVNIESARPMMAVLGHELLHELRKSNPAAYNQLEKTLKNVTKDDYIYAALLKQKYSDQGLNWTPQDISEELYGDIVGDNFMDPKFWGALAGDKPIFAKQLYRAVMNWLDKIASMFKRVKVLPDGRMVMTLAEQADGSRPFGTQKYLQDIEAARAAVAQAMGQFKQGGKGKDVLSVAGSQGDAQQGSDKGNAVTQDRPSMIGKFPVLEKSLADFESDPDSFVEWLIDAVGDDLTKYAKDGELVAVGLRSTPSKEELGKHPRHSIQTEGGGQRDTAKHYKLPATSTIGITADWDYVGYDVLVDASKYAFKEIKKYAKLGTGYIAVVAGRHSPANRKGVALDDGETLIERPKVIAYIRAFPNDQSAPVSGGVSETLSIADTVGKGIDRIRQAANAAAGKNMPRAATMGDLDAEQKAFLNKTGSSKTPSTDAIKAATDRAGLKIRQGVIDRYASLKELDEKALGQDFIGNAITDSSWVLAKMSSAGSGALNAMMTTGRLEFDDKQKVIGIKGDANGGLTATLKKLGGPDEVERFFGWIAANRAEKLLGEGRENLFTPDEVKAAKRLNEGKTEDGKARALLYTQAFKEFQEYRDDVLAIAEKSGIISDETRALWRDEFYVPFYRVMQDDNKTGGPGGGKGLSRQEAFKKLKGGRENLNDLMENTLMNFHHLLSASLKNQAASQAIRNAEKVGIASPVPESRRDTDKSTFVLKNGQKVYYEIDDPLVFESITSLSDPGLNNFAVRTMSAFKRVFTNLTTVTPQFVIANTFRDLLQASATSPTSKNVALNAVHGLKTYRDQKTRAEMLASGGAFSFGHIYGMDPDEVKASLRKTVKGADLISDPSMIPGILRKGWKHWNDAIDTSENISRAATYAQNVEGLGKLRAAFEARDVMDFSQHGAWPAVRLLVRVVPFLNARLQGLDKLYRSGVKPSILTAMGKGTDTDKQAAARFATVAGALAVATMALYMVNADDEEYQKLEEWQKDTYWFFRIGDNAFFLPKPFEVGAIATLAERTLQQFMDDKATGKLFGERVKEMLMQTFAFNPVPQMFQPIVDVYANRDAFTGRDIETMGMERLSPGLRARDTTTAVGRGLSAATRVFGDESAVAVSPVQADHLIKGYLGGVGASSAGILDTMYRAATGQESPDKRLSEYQPIRRFYRDLGAPAPNSRYSTLFYDGLREANRVYADVMELQKLGKTEEAQELRTEKQNVLRMRQQLNVQQRRLSDINQRMQTVRRADKDGEWKRREIDMLNTQKALITERMGKMIEIVRAE